MRRCTSLFAAHYEGVTAEGFTEDLAEKDWVVLLRDGAGRVRGFTTFALYESAAPGRPRERRVLGRHDRGSRLPGHDAAAAGVDPLPCWSSPRAWHGPCTGCSSRRATRRTVSSRSSEVDVPTQRPRDAGREQSVLDALASERFGERYDPATGIVRLLRPTPLRAGVADLTERRLRDPHVAFFEDRNPGHAAGDELACLARLHPDNFTAAGRRVRR